MSGILIIEDQDRYREAAKSYFSTRPDIKIGFAHDYDSAIASLSNKMDGAMIDCFFPKKLGSGDISLGKTTVETMAQLDPLEMEARNLLAGVKNYVDVTDKTIRKYTKILTRLVQNESPFFNPVAREYQDPFVYLIGEYGQLFTKEQATHYLREALERTFEGIYHGVWSEDLYQAMLYEMGKSEDCQPLGIAIAQHASDLRIPFVLVTSTFHHDTLTQPIQDFASRKSWELIDCVPGRSEEKATVKFWERAFGELERKLERS